MTNREFYEVVVKANLGEEITSKANELILAIDKKNDKAKDKRLEKVKEDEPLMNSIVESLMKTEKGMVGSDIAKAFEISTSKAIALCKKLVDKGTITVEKVKVPKVGERNLYKISQ